jgi:choline kinase
MVSVADRPLVDWLTDTARAVGINDIVLVTGYRSEMLERHVGSDVRCFENPDYENTDMVQSLWCAEDVLEGQVVISYSDILYTPRILERVVSSPHDIVVAVDEQWRAYWERRHENPLEDAESLEMDNDERIVSIGQPVDSIDEPDAQYIGLTKLTSDGVENLHTAYRDARQARVQSDGPGRSFEKLHMTDLLQQVVARDDEVYGERIAGGWVEIDTPRDFDIAQDVCQSATDGTLNIDRTEISTKK